MAVVQIILGLRSLLIKSAVFFVMAALLAWALGGTLFPRPEVVDFAPVTFRDTEWWLQMHAGGEEPGAVRWFLMQRSGGRTFMQPNLHEVEHVNALGWQDAAGPVIAGDTLYVGFKTAADGWQIAAFEQPAPVHTTVGALDRLSVERQLARVEAGLSLQDRAQERADRQAVLSGEAAGVGNDAEISSSVGG